MMRLPPWLANAYLLDDSTNAVARPLSFMSSIATRDEAIGKPASTPASGDASNASKWALATLSLCILLPSLGTSVANVALPAFSEAFGASFHQVRWVVLAYLLANTVLVVGVGRLGDRVGRRRLLMAGLALFTSASLLCGMASSLAMLIAARVAQGAGAAILMALAMALVGETVPKKQTGRAMGLLGTTSAIGTALGPSLGGALIASVGWQAIFFVNVPLGLLALCLARRHLPADHAVPKQDRTGLDGEGTVLLALLRDPVLSAGLAMSALVSTVVMATLVLGPFYLGGALGLATAGIGLVMSAGPVVAALTGVPAGRLVDRLGARRMSVVGLMGMVGGCVALCMVPVAWGVAGYVGPIVVITAHYALFQAANITAVMADVAADRRGVISGLLNLSRNLGLIMGASLMGSVFAAAAGTLNFATARPEALATGLRTAFAVATALLVLALGVAAGGQTRSQREGAPR